MQFVNLHTVVRDAFSSNRINSADEFSFASAIKCALNCLFLKKQLQDIYLFNQQIKKK